MSTAHFSCPPRPIAAEGLTARRPQHSTSSNFILSFIFRTKALRTPLNHFSYESSKNASFKQRSSTSAGLGTYLCRQSQCPATLAWCESIRRVRWCRMGSPAPGKGQRGVGGRSRHGIRQGGFLLAMSRRGFLRCFFYSAFEACAQSRPSPAAPRHTPEPSGKGTGSSETQRGLPNPISRCSTQGWIFQPDHALTCRGGAGEGKEDSSC